ncbi:MAG: antitoxin, partial [Nitrospirae bacterium]|nr:antitoxin [Nitrospirota bacterium]
AALGLEKKKRAIVYDDLDYLAGTWNEKDYLEFQKKIADFEVVDEKMWK